MDALETIEEILEEVINIEAPDLAPETSFESLGLDSLDAVELIAEVEERFNVQLASIEGIRTVGDLISRL